MAESIRILIVDDHAVVREGLQALIDLTAASLLPIIRPTSPALNAPNTRSVSASAWSGARVRSASET